jgi:hypothetical protein
MQSKGIFEDGYREGWTDLSPAALPNGAVGTAYSQTITASGRASPYTYATTAGALPAGLSLSSSGVLSGTPTTAGTSNFTITATDGASHTGNRAYSDHRQSRPHHQERL